MTSSPERDRASIPTRKVRIAETEKQAARERCVSKNQHTTKYREPYWIAADVYGKTIIIVFDEALGV